GAGNRNRRSEVVGKELDAERDSAFHRFESGGKRSLEGSPFVGREASGRGAHTAGSIDDQQDVDFLAGSLDGGVTAGVSQLHRIVLHSRVPKEYGPSPEAAGGPRTRR